MQMRTLSRRGRVARQPLETGVKGVGVAALLGLWRKTVPVRGEVGGSRISLTPKYKIMIDDCSITATMAPSARRGCGAI